MQKDNAVADFRQLISPLNHNIAKSLCSAHTFRMHPAIFLLISVLQPKLTDGVTTISNCIVYGDVDEILPDDMPEPLGDAVTTTTTINANLNHCLATGKSLTGCLHFVNKTPVDWYSKKQATVETATYGSEFVAAKTATEQIMDIRQTLRYLGAPITTKSFLFGDNRSVVTSATLPYSSLTKRLFHRVREAIAAKLMAFYWIQSAYNLSDMLSKHWDHPTVYPMILKLLITRGNITLIPRDATQEKEKEILNLQPEKLKNNEKEN